MVKVFGKELLSLTGDELLQLTAEEMLTYHRYDAGGPLKHKMTATGGAERIQTVQIDPERRVA